MQQLASIWGALDARKRLIVIASTVIVFAAILGLSRVASTPNLALLYSGLEAGTSGDVVAALDQRGVVYDVQGDAIYVDASQRDALRMSLAGEGLPAMGASGYELLDNLSGFGTTAQMFDAAYWRAKEGELARTILASAQYRSARVHIGQPPNSSFQRGTAPTASVTVSPATGALTLSQATALKYLVGSAVVGLMPENVSVIDGANGQVFSGKPADQDAQSTDDRAASLRESVQRLLEARVGFGNAIVEVSVETVTELESLTERRFDPESRVVISTETEENSVEATEAQDAVTVASNLPTGDGAPGGGSSSNNSQTRERINYEVSETQREIVRQPGAVRRLTVAVLVDGVESTNADGQLQTQPRSQDELDDLRALVASAVGFDATRGDEITIRSMAFEPLPELGTEASVGAIERLNLNIMQLIQLVVLSLVAIVMGMFVLRPIIKSAAEARPAPAALGAPEQTALSGEISEEPYEPLPPMAALPDADGSASGDISDLSLLAGLSGSTEDPVERLRKMIDDRQDETVGILRGWLENDREDA